MMNMLLAHPQRKSRFIADALSRLAVAIAFVSVAMGFDGFDS
jgi:hypothetical protein